MAFDALEVAAVIVWMELTLSPSLSLWTIAHLSLGVGVRAEPHASDH
jgi:hypothetical protein